MPHRVFRGFQALIGSSDRFEELRAFFRSLGLGERASGDLFLYEFPRTDGPRQFASLSGRRTYATLYIYPDALGRAPGHASDFYRMLDEAGFELGAKAGPSIGIDLSDE